MHPAPIILLLLPLLTTIFALILPLPPSHLLPVPPNSTLTPPNPTYTYRIPKTSLSLYINYFHFFPIPLSLLTAAINNIRNRMAQHIETSGDGWLLPHDDPIIETIPPAVQSSDDEGWDIFIQSSPVTVHITYGTVLHVMDGWETLINGPVVGPCQIFAAIQDEKRGQIGRLRMSRSKGAVENGELVVA